MHVLVLGAGVVGVTTAFELLQRGHQVTVVDRRPGPGLETSAANGAHLSASQVRSWASPMVPRYLLRWAGRADAPFRMPLFRWDPLLWTWGARYLANCTPARYGANTRALLRLARYSRQVMQDIVTASGVRFDFRPYGLLALYRATDTMRHAMDESTDLARDGLVSDEALSAEECARVEPALAAARDKDRIVGGIVSRDGATGNAAQFTAELAEVCARRGVVFHYGCTVREVEHTAGRVTGVQTSSGRLGADAVVLALANASRDVARRLGLTLPLYPVKGYSVTLPTSDAETRLPRMGILDDDRKIVLARFGGAIRVAGTAEFAGFEPGIDPRRIEPILAAARELFPGPFDGARPETANAWTGYRPLTPDGPPVLGPDARAPQGLIFNTGHGSLGWTEAAASARIVADCIDGREPALDVGPYSLARFRAQ